MSERTADDTAEDVRVKYVLGIVGGLAAAVFAALAIVPALFDWNAYRDEIATRAARALDRAVEIRGDVAVSLIPSPLVTIRDAHLANVEGAHSADTVALDSLEIRIAWAPLVVGAVRVESIKLVRPIVNVELFADGKTNLALAPKSKPEPTRPPASGAASDSRGGTKSAFDLSIQNFTIEDGTVTIRDARTGIDERIDQVTGRFALAGLSGPADASLSVRVRDIPMTVDVSLGELIQGRTMPINVDAFVLPNRARVQFSGSINELDGSPRLRGRVSLEGDSLRDAVAVIDANKAMSVPQKSFAAQTGLIVSGDELELTDLALKLDSAQGRGSVTARFGASRSIDATLGIGFLDLDSLLRAPEPTEPSRASRRTPPAAPATHDMAVAAPRDQDATPPDAAAGLLGSLPADLTANLTFSVEGVTLRGSAIRQARLDVSLAGRELTVSQLSVLLPGNSDVAAFGFVTEKDGTAQFDGTIEATSSDVRTLLGWFGLPASQVSAGRLRGGSANAKLSARHAQVVLNDLTARIDSTKITGALTASFGDRSSVGANLVADQVNVDAYLPGESPQGGAPTAASPADGTPPPRSAAAHASDPFAILGGMDANVRLRLGSAIYSGVTMNDLRLDAALSDGTLDVRSASIADAAGVSASLSGTVAGLGGGSAGAFDLAFSGVILKAEGKSLVNLFRAANVKSPVSPQALGPVSVSTRLGGSLRALDVIGDINAMGGRFSYDGRVVTRDLLPRLEARLSLAHPDFTQLLRAFGSDYRPRAAKGPIALDANLAGGLFEIGLSRLSGNVAGLKLQGSGAARLPYLGGSSKPLVVLKLVTGDLDIDSFLPAKRTAELRSEPAIQHAALRSASGSGGTVMTVASVSSAPWSSDPLDLSILGALDGSFSLKSDSLSYESFRLAHADIDMELQKGVLEVRRLTGETLGGELTVDGRLQSESIGGKFEARYALTNLDVAAADGALGASRSAQGDATLEGRLAGAGSSLAALIASLDGEGALALRGIGGALKQGSVFAALGGLAQSLEQLGGLRGALEPISLTVTGPYRVEGGVIGFDELSFQSPIGEGAMKGNADLPKWQIRANGEIRLAKEFVIGGKQTKPIPFSVTGRLDAPSVKIDIAALPGGGLQVPLDKLRTRKGVGEVLKGLLPKAPPKRERPEVEALPPPGVEKKPDAPPPAKAENPAASEDKRPATGKGARVEDILRDILRGVSR